MKRIVYGANMSTMRETWTDERLDEGFREMRAEVKELRRESAAFRAEMNARFDSLQQSLQRTMVQVGGGLFATFAVGFLGLSFG